MRITEQVMGVVDYGGEAEDVIFCLDGVEEARKMAQRMADIGPFTLCRVRIIEVVE